MAPTEPENPEYDDLDDAPAPEVPPARSKARPDWLVGADEGANAEMQRNRATDRPHAPLRLVRPGEVAQPTEEDDGIERPEGFERLPLMRAEDTIRAAPPVAKPKKSGPDAAAWQAASSSIPKLRRTAQVVPNVPIAPAARPVQREFDPEENEEQGSTEHVNEARAAAAPLPALKPIHEPWWMVVLDAVQTNGRVQLGILIFFVILGVLAFQPWQARPTPLSKIRKHPELFDGSSVMVHGRVGDVYAIAGGYTYFLLQGRDTMVVFTHSTTPHMDERLTVHGIVSTGYLDGLPRQAIFEDKK